GGVLAHRRGGGLHAHRLVVDELALPRHHYYRAAEAAVGDLFLQRRADLGEALRGHAYAFGLRRRQRRRGRRERGERDDEREPGERGARGPRAIHGCSPPGVGTRITRLRAAESKAPGERRLWNGMRRSSDGPIHAETTAACSVDAASSASTDFREKEG